MARRWTRRGISRWNVFGIILLVAVLLSLVLPAIQSSREAARRNACSNNLSQIVAGLASYQDTHKMFPMGAMHAGPNPGCEPPVTAALGPSWWFGILPLMDRPGGPNVLVTHGPKSVGNLLTNAGGPMYDRIIESQRPGQDLQYQFCADDISRYLRANPYTASDGQDVGQLTISMLAPPYMRCPSSPVAMSETSTGPIMMPSYVGIAGGCDIDPKSLDYQVKGLPSECIPLDAKQIYHNNYKGTGATVGGIVTSSGLLPPCQHVKLRDCTDGASNTMIVAEQSDWLLLRNSDSRDKYHGGAGWTMWTGADGGLQPGAGSGRPSGAGGGWLSGTRRVDPIPMVDTLGGLPAVWGGDCWNIATVRYPPNLKRVLGTEAFPGCSENHGINNPLQSPHPGGLMVGMADGSVQFIQQTTDLEVVLRLSIRDNDASLRN